MGKTAIYRVAIAAGTGHVSEPMESVPMAASLGTRVLIAEMTAHQTVEATKVVQPRPSFVPTAVSQVLMDFSVTKLPMLQWLSVLPSVQIVYHHVNPMDVQMVVWMGFLDIYVTVDVIAPKGLPVSSLQGLVLPQGTTPRPTIGQTTTVPQLRHHVKGNILVRVYS